MRPQAEAAVIAVHGADQPLDEVDERVPDQRAIGEEPDIARLRPLGEHPLDRRLVLLRADAARLGIRRLDEGAQAVAENGLASEGERRRSARHAAGGVSCPGTARDVRAYDDNGANAGAEPGIAGSNLDLILTTGRL